jgi:hypothetical protein
MLTETKHGKCDLIVSGVLDQEQVEFYYEPTQELFVHRQESEDRRTLSELQTALKEDDAVITFLCLPPGEREVRMPETSQANERGE